MKTIARFAYGVLVAMFLFHSVVSADVSYFITVKDTDYAVFTLTYTAGEGSVKIKSPAGVTFSEENTGEAYTASEGKISIGIRHAEAGKWQVVISGDIENPQMIISSNPGYGTFVQNTPTETEPAATPTPLPTPAPTPTPTPSPTPLPTPIPTATPTPDPTSVPSSTAAPTKGLATSTPTGESKGTLGTTATTSSTMTEATVEVTTTLEPTPTPEPAPDSEMELDYFDKPKFYYALRDTEYYQDWEFEQSAGKLLRTNTIELTATVENGSIGITSQNYYVWMEDLAELQTSDLPGTTVVALTSETSQETTVPTEETSVSTTVERADAEPSALSIFWADNQGAIILIGCGALALVGIVLLIVKNREKIRGWELPWKKKKEESWFFVYRGTTLVLKDKLKWNWNIAEIHTYLKTLNIPLLNQDCVVMDLGCLEDSAFSCYVFDSGFFREDTAFEGVYKKLRKESQ